MNFRKQVLLSTITLSLLAACSKPLTEEEQLNVAKQNIVAGKIAEASINIKNVIQENPKNAQARYLLGSLYFEQEQYLAAEKELLRSIEFEPGNLDTRLLLAKTFHALNKNEQVVEMLDGLTFDSKNNQLMTHFLLGKSYFALENLNSAKENFDTATLIDPNSKESQLGQILFDTSQNNVDVTSNDVAKLLEKFPNYEEALLLQGNLYNQQARFALAADAYEHYFSLKPKNFAVRLLASYNHVRAGNIAQAKSHIEALNKINDRHPTINLIDSQIQFAEQDFAKAKELADRVANNTNNGLAQMISGLSSYYLSNYEQAYYQLNAIADALPADHQVHRVLALLQVKLGYVDDFEQELLSDESLNNEDVELITAIGMEEFYKGNNNSARDLFLKAADLSPNDAKVKAQLGMIKINNKDNSGIQDLQKAIEIDPTFKGANVALTIKHLVDGDITEAKKVAENWVAKEPNNPEPLVLRGNVSLKTGDKTEAKKYFLKAREIAPQNTVSLFNLAVLTSGNKNYDESNQYLDEIFAISLESKLAFQLAIQNALATNSEATLEKKLHSMIKSSPDAMWPRIVLGRRYQKQGDVRQAIELYEENLNYVDLTNDYMASYTGALFANKDFDKLTGVFSQWQNSQPNNKTAYTAAINYYEKSNNFNKALEVAQDAISISRFSNDVELLSYEAYFLLATGSTELAAKKVNSLAQRSDENPFVQRVQGQTYLAQEDFSQAQIYLTKSYEQRKHAATGINLAIAMEKNQGSDQAIAFLRQEIDQKVHVNPYTKYLAQLQIADSPKNAIQNYQRLLARTPNDVVSLNNVAWLLSEQNKYDEAKIYAKKAAQLVPSNPQVLDTLGVIYLKNNEVDASLRVLEKAFSLSKNDVEIASHLVKAYQRNNLKNKADAILSGFSNKDRETILKLIKEN